MSTKAREEASRATPIVYQQAYEIQAYGHVISMPIALSEKTRQENVDNLNQLLADNK